MNNIKQYINSHFKTISIVTISIIFSMFLLMIRVKISHSFFYLFLVWNLFLAVIPFAITTYLESLQRINKPILLLLFIVWLLFLPNAPYIVTDLVHLRLSKTKLIWLDIITVFSFAFNGLILFYLSLFNMLTLLKKHIKPKFVKLLIAPILFLTAFGIYLGRFLRYNSWELLSNPFNLLEDILDIISNPFSNKQVWLFTILFGGFLHVGYLIFNNFNNENLK